MRARKNKAQRESAREAPERIRAYKRKQTYGLDEAGFAALLERQGGKCAICPKQLDPNARRGLHVDHDHATGKIRGLLCNGCNCGLGMFKDSPAFLRAAACYLE